MWSIISGHMCKERWESLRGQYRKHMSKKAKKGSEVGFNNFKWRHEERMSFLCAYMKPKPSHVSLTEEGNESDESYNIVADEKMTKDTDNEEESVSLEVDPLQLHYKRPKYSSDQENGNDISATALTGCLMENNGNQDEKRIDPIDTFFSLMATTVKNFTPADKYLVKTQVFSLVTNIEAKYIPNEDTKVSHRTGSC